MGKVCQNIRAQWTEEDLRSAVQAVKNGSPIATAARKFNIPRRTLRDWAKRENTPIRKLGRNPVLSPEIESSLKKRVVRLQQVGFGLTPSIVKRKAAEIAESLNIKTPFKDHKAGRFWFKGFMKRNTGLCLRKAESLSYGRLMRFNREITSGFFKLLKEVYDKIALQPENIYNVDEIGLQLTYDGKEKVLAAKGSKCVHKATHGEKGETVTVVACTNAAGTNWIPPMILYKGKYSKQEFGDKLPAGSIFAMTPKGYITTEVFCQFLRHFHKHRVSGNALLILDGHKSHMDVSVLEVAEEIGVTILCLPAHCSHELQPLDKSFFKSLKVYWNEAVDKFRRQYPGHSLGKLQFPEIFTEAWYRAATPKNAVSGFKGTGIFPFNPEIIPDTAYAPSSVSEQQKIEGDPTSTPSPATSSDVVAGLSDKVHELLSTPRIERKAGKRKSANAKATLLRRDLFSAAGSSLGQNSSTQTKKKDKDLYCGDCHGYYYDKRNKNSWIQCTDCKTWFHENCDNGSVKNGGLCSLCEDGCALLSDSE